MSEINILPFNKALQTLDRVRHRYLLLGNGFSIALRPDIFTYGSLYKNADFSAAPHVPALFQALNTEDFEIVIRHLQNAAMVVEVYRPNLPKLAARLRTDASAIKDALVTAVAHRHPNKPYDIDSEKYAACREFLSNFDHIFTLNYDVLLYWTLMQDEVDNLHLRPDDGFRHPEDDPDLPWVSWQEANSPTVHYLHGALHLFDSDTDIIKYTWSKTDTPIVNQIREALKEDKYPLFVAEGTSDSKRSRILHNAYLHKALRSFEGCCKQKNAAIIVFGHSLADNDMHILKHVAKGGVSNVLVSIYGDKNSQFNQEVIKNALALADLRMSKNSKSPLKVTFYDAASAQVWG